MSAPSWSSGAAERKNRNQYIYCFNPSPPRKKGGKNRRSLWVEVNSRQRLKGCEGEVVSGKYEETREPRIGIFCSIPIKLYYFGSCIDHTGRQNSYSDDGTGSVLDWSLPLWKQERLLGMGSTRGSSSSVEAPSSRPNRAKLVPARAQFKGCVELKVPEGKGIKMAPNSALTCRREGWAPELSWNTFV